MDLRSLSLISEALLAVFLSTLVYQGRMVCLEKRGYVRNPRYREEHRMRERLEELLKLS